MFGLGTWELVLVLVVAVLFLGPDKLPELAKTLGKSVRSVQKAMSGVDTSMRPVQNAARKLNESIDRAVDLDGDYEEDEDAEPPNTSVDDAPPPDNEPGESANGPVAAANPFAPVEVDEDSPAATEQVVALDADVPDEEQAKDEFPT